MLSEKIAVLFRSHSWATSVGLAFAAVVLARTTPAWATGTVASGVLGQPDSTHSTANIPDAASMSINGTTPVATAVDKSSGHVYVTDFSNQRVLGWNSAAALMSGAPADLVIGQPNFFSVSANAGVGVNAGGFNGPRGLAVDSNHNVYIADYNNNRVLVFSDPFAIKMSTGQTAGFTALMVFGQAGDFTSNGCNVGAGSSRPSSQSTLCNPSGVALDSANNLYIADFNNNRVLEFNTPVATGSMSANLVIGQIDFTHNASNQAGTVGAKTLSSPEAVAIDSNNNLYVVDEGNSRVLFYPAPLVGMKGNDQSATKVWGQTLLTAGNCNAGGPASATTLCLPTGVALDSSNNVYIADTNNERVVEYNEGANPPTNFTGNLAFGQASTTTFAGCNRGGAPSAITLCTPSGLSLDSSNDLFVLDSSNNRVLEYLTPLATDATADVVLGQLDFAHTVANSVDASSFNQPLQMALDKSVSPNHLYVADQSNNRVLGWQNATSFTNGQAADIVIGQPDFQSNAGNRGGSVGAGGFNSPRGVAVDASANLYVADTNNNRVLKFTTPFTGCAGFPCVGGNAGLVLGQSNFTNNNANQGGASPTSSTLHNPTKLALDAAGNLYVTDYNNHRVLEYTAPLTTNGQAANLVFGQGTMGNEFTTANCAVPPTMNSLCNPDGVTIDSSKNVYIADFGNSRVLQYSEASSPPTNVTPNLVFGQNSGFTTSTCRFFNITVDGADDLCMPIGVSVDGSGNLFVGDQGDNRMLEYFNPLAGGGGTPGTPGSSGDTTADTVWGQGGSFASDQANLGGGAGPSAATLNQTEDVLVDGSGNVFITDPGNNRLLLFNPPFPPPGAVAPRGGSSGLLSVKPAALTFSAVAFGRESRPKKLTVGNTGKVPVKLGEISATAADYLLGGTCSGVLPAGATCTIAVIFKPAAIGQRGSAVIIRDDAGNSPQIVRIKGRAVRRRHSR